MLTVTPHDHEDGTITAALAKAATTHLTSPGKCMVLGVVLGNDGKPMTPRLMQPYLRHAIGDRMQYTVKTKGDTLHVWRLA